MRSWQPGDRVYTPNGAVIHLVAAPPPHDDGVTRTVCNKEVDMWWQGEDAWADREEEHGHICKQCLPLWKTVRDGVAESS